MQQQQQPTGFVSAQSASVHSTTPAPPRKCYLLSALGFTTASLSFCLSLSYVQRLELTDLAQHKNSPCVSSVSSYP